jgi:hypothetical protein
MRARITTLGLALTFVLLGCSQDGPMGPDNYADGSVSILISNSEFAVMGTPEFTPPLIDSAVVRIFRPDGKPEASQGAAVPDVGQISLVISCVAELNKRVSIELYDRGQMVYHGVNEDVDVVTNQNTKAAIDAYFFQTSGLSFGESVVVDGSPFMATWAAVPGATQYLFQASMTPGFEAIDDERIVADAFTSITRNPGAHYFRVAAMTDYASGTFTVPGVGYVLGGALVQDITGLSELEVIPGETVSIRGENLDFPDVQVFLGPTQCSIISRAWDELVIEIPRVGESEIIWVSSSLGFASSDDVLRVSRIAYVSKSETNFDQYKRYIEYYPSMIANSSVVSIRVTELDWRDMSVFDVIVLASDLGSSAQDWGDGVPARANVVANSGANILAIGVGGGIYLGMTTPVISGLNMSAVVQATYYLPNGTEAPFTTPIVVTAPGPINMQFCVAPVISITLQVDDAAKPGALNLYAETFVNSDEWTLADFSVNFNQRSVKHFFWGYAGDPSTLTIPAADCLNNVVFDLYKDSGAVIPAAVVSRR